MRLFRPLLVVLCLTLLVPLGASAAEGRVALVIGNAGYKEAPLRNPVNDARAIAAALRQLNFDVIEVEDATNKAMQMAVIMFSRKMGPDVTSLFYYAGHGVQFDGNNYLVPLGAELDSELSFGFETLDVGDVIKAMERSGSRLNIVILDACRNNPFERRLRGQSRGLAAIDAATGTLIAYATAPGSVAADGDGENGLYTEALLNALEQPGLQVEEMFKQVRVEVSERSNGQQVPWESSSLTGDFVFRPGKTASDKQMVESDSNDALYWESIKDSGVAALYQTYVDKFPNGIFIPIARHKLEQFDEGAATGLEVVVSAPDEGEERAEKVVLLLASAQESLSALRLTTPEGNNAFDQFSGVLALEADNVEAQSGLAKIADKYIGLANQAAERGDLEGAEVYLVRAEGVTPGNESIAYAQESIEAEARLAEEQHKAEEEAKRLAEEKQREAEEAERLAEKKRKAGEEAIRLAEEEKRKAEEAKRIAVASPVLAVGDFDGDWEGKRSNCKAGPQTFRYQYTQYLVLKVNDAATTLKMSYTKYSEGNYLPDPISSFEGTITPEGVISMSGNYEGVHYVLEGRAVNSGSIIGTWSATRGGKPSCDEGEWEVHRSTSGVLPKCSGGFKNNWNNCFGTSIEDYYGGHGRDHKYVGEFRDGKFNGQGTYIWSDGSKYVGEFSNNAPNGSGIFTGGLSTQWAGGKYVGNFKDWKFQGEGIYYHPDGKVEEGIWENDEFLYAKKLTTEASSQNSADAEEP